MKQRTQINVTVNGTPHTFAPGTSIDEVVRSLELGGRKFAVERNRQVLPRAQHATTQVADGDVLEVVTFVGGG